MQACAQNIFGQKNINKKTVSDLFRNPQTEDKQCQENTNIRSTLSDFWLEILKHEENIVRHIL